MRPHQACLESGASMGLRTGPAGRYITAGTASRELVGSRANSKFLYRLRNSQMQANCRCCGSYPSSSPSSSATPSITASIDSGAKPRAASQRAVFAVGPRRAARRTARSRSGSSAASAGSRDSGSIPSRSSLKAIAASPRPRSASAAARTWANRSSSIAPCRRRVATASSRSGSRMPFRSRASRTACSEWSWRARTRAPAATASLRRSTRPGRAGRSAVTLGIGRSLLLSRLLLGGHFDRGRQQSRRDHLVGSGVGLDLRQDLLGHVRVLAQKRGCVLAALAEPLVAEAEVRARFRDDLPLEPRVEHRTFPGNARAVDDVELGLLERWRNLVLDHLDANPVAVGLDAFLESLDPADVETDRRIELQGAAARCGLRRIVDGNVINEIRVVPFDLKVEARPFPRRSRCAVATSDAHRDRSQRRP